MDYMVVYLDMETGDFKAIDLISIENTAKQVKLQLEDGRYSKTFYKRDINNLTKEWFGYSGSIVCNKSDYEKATTLIKKNILQELESFKQEVDRLEGLINKIEEF